MLVLSRKVGETIVIDGRIRIYIADIRGDAVRLSFDVPDEVVVDREEIWEEKQRDKGAR